MKILAEAPKTIIHTDFLLDQYHSSLYDISQDIVDHVENQLVPGNTVVLFSGCKRFNFDATYIEPKFVASVTSHPKAIFVDPPNKELLNYTLKRLQIKNLLVLNTNVFIKYRDWTEINADIENLKTYASRIIVTMPLNRFNFNRLKYSNEDIAGLLNGTIIDGTVVICR